MIRFVLGFLCGVATTYAYALFLSATPESRDAVAPSTTTTAGGATYTATVH